MKTITFGPTARLLSCVTATAFLASCVPPPGGSCFLGQPVTIPASDSTPPTLVVDFHLADGSLVTVQSGGQAPADIISPDGTVTINAVARDAEGVRDVQLWIAARKCTSDAATGTTSCSGPGLLGAPTASNRDGGAPGATGCTERLTSQSVQVVHTQVRDDSYEVSVRGENFGGQTVQIGLIRLRAN